MGKISKSSGFVNYLNEWLKEEEPTTKLPKPLPIKLQLAILSNGGGYTTPRAIRSIERATGNPIKEINYSSPLDTQTLSNEVRIILNHIEKHNLKDKFLSRADAFINLVQEDKINFVNEKNKPVKKLCLEIINKISVDSKELDGIFLPGGEDIPSIWYGGDECHSVYRSIVEFALINQARKKGIPLMGVCRGSQIVNVYNDKKLEQDVPNQYGDQKFTLLKKGIKGLLAKFFEEGVTGEVMHHQGVSIQEGTNGKGDLEALTAYDGLVKACESKYPASAPVILTQFHPECFDPDSPNQGLSTNNGEFIKTFHASAIVRGNKRLFITPDQLAECRKNLTPPGKREIKWQNLAFQKNQERIKAESSMEGKLKRLVNNFLKNIQAWNKRANF